TPSYNNSSTTNPPPCNIAQPPLAVIPTGGGALAAAVEGPPHWPLPLPFPSPTPVFLSSPSNPPISHNQHHPNDIINLKSWHTSFPPSRIIKSVSKTKQTRPAAG